jgi:hypothetical protein
MVHEGDEPNAVVDFLDAEALTGSTVETLMHADAPASGDEGIAIMEPVVQFRHARMGS